MVGARHSPRPMKNLVAVQGFGRQVAHRGLQYERNFLSGRSIKSFTPDTADMSLNPTNRQDGNIKEQFYL
jgi:hypothetical protein